MTVLVSYIPVPEGWAALNLAIEEAALRQTSVSVINVAVGPNFTDVTFADEKDLDAVRERLTAVGLAHSVDQIQNATDVAEEILAAATRLEAVLVVVGLRRRSPLGMALLGSNAQRIILSANCPVLSVRPSSA